MIGASVEPGLLRVLLAQTPIVYGLWRARRSRPYWLNAGLAASFSLVSWSMVSTGLGLGSESVNMAMILGGAIGLLACRLATKRLERPIDRLATANPRNGNFRYAPEGESFGVQLRRSLRGVPRFALLGLLLLATLSIAARGLHRPDKGPGMAIGRLGRSWAIRDDLDARLWHSLGLHYGSSTHVRINRWEGEWDEVPEE